MSHGPIMEHFTLSPCGGSAWLGQVVGEYFTSPPCCAIGVYGPVNLSDSVYATAWNPAGVKLGDVKDVIERLELQRHGAYEMPTGGNTTNNRSKWRGSFIYLEE